MTKKEAMVQDMKDMIMDNFLARATDLAYEGVRSLGWTQEMLDNVHESGHPVWAGKEWIVYEQYFIQLQMGHLTEVVCRALAELS